ncbi:MAG: TRAP transporter substrate-binding protein DctP [Candidatus Magnetomorum sp.]|nr:TRAP transporter substrate-binding protein DctP [Candidatus Magnetomorum sp.]
MRSIKNVCVLSLITVLFLASSQVSAKSKLRLKFATLAPKTLGWALQIQNIFIPAFHEATDNKISIKWYWGGLRGDDRDYIELMNKGELDGAALAGHGVMLACPEMSALELPFLFRNYDEVDYVRERMHDRFNQLAEKYGYKILFWGDQDFDQIYSTQTSIQTLNDFKSITFAVDIGSAIGPTHHQHRS